MRKRLKRNTKLLGRLFPILGIVPPGEPEAKRLKRELLKAGIFPSLIKYPGGPPTGYFRFAVSSEHTPAQIKLLLAVIRPYQ